MFRAIQILFLTFLFNINILAISITSNDNYNSYKTKNYSIIYTDQYINEAKFIKINIDDFIKHNNKSFGYSFDEPIKIVLISNNIQVPNAFSTQVPFNMGVYYNGGSDMNDEFSSSSWLTLLFVHEMIHNFQTNAKKSKISKTLHKYFGNNYMPIMAVIPMFTLPNIMIPTSLLEGNAVLNETLYNNGGRLYNGEAQALKNSMVFYNKITPQSFINDHTTFPYGKDKYIVGGFYMQYLAYKYGIDKVNQFFYEQSIHSINPMILNETFINHFSISFEQTIYDFVNFTKIKFSSYKELNQKNIIATSQAKIYFSNINHKIYFITSNLKTKKNLNIYDIKTSSLKVKKTNLNNGRIVLKNDTLYINHSSFISSKLYKHGLFDEKNHIEKSTVGKSIQDIKNNSIAYIDINKSFLDSKLYLNDKFYANISSNALFDNNDNLYYFKQNKSKKELFKNKQKILEFASYYAKVIDIIDDDIYFISNTSNGSGLYLYSNSKLYLLSQSDNIIDAKILTNKTALVSTITANNYSVYKITITKNNPTFIPKVKNIKLKKEFSFKKDINNIDLKKSLPYNELSNLEFSLLYPSYTYDSKNGNQYMFKALFMDPVMFNMLNLYTYKDKDTRVAGLSYINERHFIPFAFNMYNIKRDITTNKNRTYGGTFELYGPIIKKGRDILSLSLKQYFYDENKNKNPILFVANHTFNKSFPLASKKHLSSDSKLLFKYDRKDNIYGFNYNFTKHIFSELYFDIQIKVVNSNSNISLNEQRGIKVVTNILDLDDDSTNILIEGNDYNFYTKNIQKYSIGLSKSFHINKYFSKFPISLKNQSIFIKYNYFELKDYDKKIKEKIVGLNFNMLFFHKLPVPITIKYIQNDFSKDDEQFKFSFGAEF